VGSNNGEQRTELSLVLEIESASRSEKELLVIFTSSRPKAIKEPALARGTVFLPIAVFAGQILDDDFFPRVRSLSRIVLDLSPALERMVRDLHAAGYRAA